MRGKRGREGRKKENRRMENGTKMEKRINEGRKKNKKLGGWGYEKGK